MSNNFALKATVLITIDARSGEWVSLDTIVARVVTAKDRVKAICDDLVATNQVQYASRNGMPCYGINVEGVAP